MLGTPTTAISYHHVEIIVWRPSAFMKVSWLENVQSFPCCKSLILPWFELYDFLAINDMYRAQPGLSPKSMAGSVPNLPGEAKQKTWVSLNVHWIFVLMLIIDTYLLQLKLLHGFFSWNLLMIHFQGVGWCFPRLLTSGSEALREATSKLLRVGWLVRLPLSHPHLAADFMRELIPTYNWNWLKLYPKSSKYPEVWGLFVGG